MKVFWEALRSDPYCDAAHALINLHLEKGCTLPDNDFVPHSNKPAPEVCLARCSASAYCAPGLLTHDFTLTSNGSAKAAASIPHLCV